MEGRCGCAFAVIEDVFQFFQVVENEPKKLRDCFNSNDAKHIGKKLAVIQKLHKRWCVQGGVNVCRYSEGWKHYGM